ncbi:hypothetical protein [Zunongwangia atlantica]|uniref:Uncharacterized protein n=1 Tax=Zunongwangia atlantica 22II14-10F7 TaxID=1185767 RepID=A0A1Y1T6Y4_9FLAO|nr:hypothetical protein [Zunongwangia atlantica]ORL46806.1 hypothetical protein IIF7_04781 [Zunongwangia atlantica 22II14-10F7]
MIVESYTLDILDQDKLVHLLKILAFQFSDYEIHPFTLEDKILIIVSSKTEIEDNFISLVKSEGFNCKLLMVS